MSDAKIAKLEDEIKWLRGILADWEEEFACLPEDCSIPEYVWHMERERGCICQGCGERYVVDIIVPDELWESIKPESASKGGRLLCGRCIIKALEQRGYSAWKLSEI